MFEAIPLSNNPEFLEFGGAYINCWVKGNNETVAYNNAKNYINEEGWKIISIEEKFIAQRSQYEDDSESLECFEQAVSIGIGALFHTWPLEKR
jgi:hypothetical protein